MTPLTDKVAELLHPLSDFYDADGRQAPRIETVEGPDMPRPQRDLLFHERDMTPTLQQHFADTIHLEPLRWHEMPEALYRQVVLVLDGDGRRVEFGAIKIHLPRFDGEPRRLILEGRRPLGRILHDFAIPHRSHPTGYFRMESDPVVRDALGLTGPRTLYGRHNVLLDGEDRPLAEVVEILPPLDEGFTDDR